MNRQNTFGDSRLTLSPDEGELSRIIGFSRRLTRLYGEAGGFTDASALGSQLRDLRFRGRQWLDTVRPIITNLLADTPAPSSFTLADIPQLLKSYDSVYRICYGHSDSLYLRDTIIATADRWLKGNRDITSTDIALLILGEMQRDHNSLPDRYVDFALDAVGNWIEQLTIYRHFPGIPDAEAYRRLEYLLRDDLSLSLGKKEKTIKKNWAKTYWCEDPSLLDTRTLQSYIPFALTASLRGFLPPHARSYFQRDLSLAAPLGEAD